MLVGAIPASRVGAMIWRASVRSLEAGWCDWTDACLCDLAAL